MLFFFTPRYIKKARRRLCVVYKALRYQKDLLTPRQLRRLREDILQLQAAIRQGEKNSVIFSMQALEKYTLQVMPRRNYAGWRENVEMILVAVVLAASIRAYFLQPFKIPSGSMQPTLFGIVGQPSPSPPPPLPARILEFIVYGRSYLNVIAQFDETILHIEEHRFLNFFTFTQLKGTKHTYWTFAPSSTLYSCFGVSEGRFYRHGQAIARGMVTSGDQLFVDKLGYHFTSPRRGDIFVFRTLNIPKIRSRRLEHAAFEHYIKRLVGVPGDTLRIDSPLLFVNGQVALEARLRQVMSCENGFQGYANVPSSLYLATPQETFTVPPNSYFALGDNSYNSSDSREWGVVPRGSVVGRALFILWPFSSRWGWIH
ncbi:MAG: signal peptidase I [Candidatus Xiphinematobacter sp.]|nr:MAG: signal peptidase I [Candidatus Xiphinematobacter sp.]